MKPNTLITEARARIIWGERYSSVREFLTSNGLSATEADASIHEFEQERHAAIRKHGIKNVLLGTVLLAAVAILLYLSFAGPEFGGDIHSLAAATVGGVFGIWKLVNGLIYLLRPQSEDRSVAEVIE